MKRALNNISSLFFFDNGLLFLCLISSKQYIATRCKLLLNKNATLYFLSMLVFLPNFSLLVPIYLDIPQNWQLGFQNPATPVMEGIIWLHNYILMFLIIVVIVVFWFLARSLLLFNEYFNSVPMEFNHDPVIEAIWTIAPAFVLVAIAIPSFSLLYSVDEIIKPALTVKIIGHQWYWSYELDNVSRQDVFYDYAKRPSIRSLDVLDVFTAGKKQVLQYFVARDVRWQKCLNRLFMQKGMLTVIRTNNGITMSNLSFLAIASKMVWKYATYRSLIPLSSSQRVGITSAPIVIKSPFFALLKPITHRYAIISTVKWLSPSLRFDSYMLPETDLPFGGLRLLEVDNRLVLPVKVHIRLLITSTDVIHSWAVPSFGVKVDAIPGRLNQAGLYIKRAGFFYGQCSELCGVNHGFMPIVVQSVDYNTFAHWIKINSNPTRLDALLNSNWSLSISDLERKR